MGNWVNWLLVIGGMVCVIIELALGALTGFDLALQGASLAVGGGIGLLVGSGEIGLLAAGVLALLYLAAFRSWLKTKLTVKDQASNGEAEAMKLVSNAAETYFKERAEMMRRLEVLNNTLAQNTKYIIPSSSGLVNILGLGGAMQSLPKPLSDAPAPAASGLRAARSDCHYEVLYDEEVSAARLFGRDHHSEKVRALAAKKIDCPCTTRQASRKP